MKALILFVIIFAAALLADTVVPPEDLENAEIQILNVKGQKVKVFILSNGILGACENSVVWNGMDENGKPVSSGVHFYKLKSDKVIFTNKMILMRYID